MNEIKKVIKDFGIEVVNEKDEIVVVASSSQKALLKAVVSEIEQRKEEINKNRPKEDVFTKIIMKEDEKIINLIKNNYV